MEKRIGKNGIERKLLGKVTLVFFISYVVFSAASFYMLFSTLSQQITADNRRMLGTVESQLAGIMSTCQQSETQIISDEELADRIREVDKSHYPYVAAYHVNEVLARYVRTMPYIETIALMGPDRSFHSTGVNYEQITDSFRNEKWFLDFKQSGKRNILSPIYEDMTNNRRFKVFSYVARYINVFSPEKEELFLFLSFSVDNIRSQLGSQDLLVTNNWGEQICSSHSIEPQQVDKLSFKDNMEISKGYYIFRGQVQDGELQIYLPVSAGTIFSGAADSLVVLAVLFALCLGAMVLLVSITVKRMLKPVYVLRNAMEFSAKGRFDIRAEVKSKDEFEYLANGYNLLIDRLQGYIHELRENEAIKTQMQNDLLMSQIHPHFIYNTLNSAVYLVEEGENSGAIQVIDSLIDILQNTVRMGEKEIFTTVKQELKLLSAYLCIQAVRYPESFVCNVSCSQELEEQYLPRVTIQPLVENALFHGILPKEEPGEISVKIYKDRPGRMTIEVRDNGVGIKDMEHIFQRQAGDSHRIGLANIKNRISYLFGNLPAGVEIESKPGQGTCVTIFIPIDE